MVLALALVVSALARPARAEERHPFAAELAAGTHLFADDGVAGETFAGAAARYYILPRISVGPELVWASGVHHDHLMVTGNTTFDLLSAGNSRRIVPFVVAGGGLFRTNETFANGASFSSTEGAFTAGGGVRALLGNRVIVGAEARVGWELHVRFNAMAGGQLGR